MKPSFDLGIGKLPPQIVEAEELVLGAILLERGAIDEVIADLPDDAFYKRSHQLIYRACKSLFARNEPIDIQTVIYELRRTQDLDAVGGAYYVSTLTNRVGSSANIKSHARMISQCFAKREIIRICQENCAAAYDDSSDHFELFDNIDKQIQDCKEKILGGAKNLEWTFQLSETVSIIEALQQAEIKVSGIPTGNAKIDSITGGWQRSDLIIMAGRPGSGKTSRALNFVKAACLYHKKVVIFSMEMSYQQIARKFLNEESEIYGNKLMTGDISTKQLEDLKTARTKLASFNIHLNDKGGVTPNYIRTVLKQRQKKHGVDFVVIDYVQLMRPNDQVKGRSRDVEVGTISTAIKNIAKEFDIPVLLLAQLNRKCEERNDKRPILSDLRESGSLENDADMVIGLYRPSYYYSWDKDRDYKEDINNGMTEEEYKRISELHILKHRNGQTDRYIREHFYGEFSRFTDISTTSLSTANRLTEPREERSEFEPF